MSFGILRDCLELIFYDNSRISLLLPSRNQESRQLIGKVKKLPSYQMLVKLLYHFMSHLDLSASAPHTLREQLRNFNASSSKFPCKSDEREAILGKTKGRISFVRKLVEVATENDWLQQPWWPGEVISLIVSNVSKSPALIHDIGYTIADDIKEYYSHAASLPLHAALAFCHSCPSPGDVEGIFVAAAENAHQMKDQRVTFRREPAYLGGESHLDFFRTLATMKVAACMSEEDSGYSPHLAGVLGHASEWAPPIHMYDSYPTRQKVCQFLDELIFDEYPHELDDNDVVLIRLTHWRSEAARLLMRKCNMWMNHAQKRGCPKPWGEHILKVMHECAKWLDKFLQEDSEAYAVFIEHGDEELISVYDRAKISVGRWRSEDDWLFRDGELSCMKFVLKLTQANT